MVGLVDVHWYDLDLDPWPVGTSFSSLRRLGPAAAAEHANLLLGSPWHMSGASGLNGILEPG